MEMADTTELQQEKSPTTPWYLHGATPRYCCFEGERLETVRNETADDDSWWIAQIALLTHRATHGGDA